MKDISEDENTRSMEEGGERKVGMESGLRQNRFKKSINSHKVEPAELERIELQRE